MLVQPYEDYVAQFNEAAIALLTITPTIKSVDTLADENKKLEFVTKFRELLRLKNVLTTFADFEETDLTLEAQKFEDYKSKYLDVYDSVKKERNTEKPSILDEVDFELSLIHRDEINVAYILNLLRSMSKTDPAAAQKRQKEILDLMAGEVQLRSKRALIETFIENNLQQLQPHENAEQAFEDYWLTKKAEALNELCITENIVPEKLSTLINNYTFANRLPRSQEIISALTFKPKILERQKISDRISEKLKSFIDTFIEGMGGTV